MIYIIRMTVPLNHVQQITDGCNNIGSVQSAEIIIMHTVGGNNLNRRTFLFLGHDFYHFTAAENPALTENFHSLIINDGIRLDNYFPGFRINNRSFRSVPFQTVFP